VIRELANDVERPAGLGELEITITPPMAVDGATVDAYEKLGVHRLALMRDFGDLAGAPDGSRRDKLLRSLEQTAKELGLR
jgi:hypothetical protein